MLVKVMMILCGTVEKWVLGSNKHWECGSLVGVDIDD